MAILASWLLLLPGCEVVRQASRDRTQRDLVTGEYVLNRFSLEQEAQLAAAWEPQFIQAEQQDGFEVDADALAVKRIRTIITQLVAVCHLPGIQWRVHYSSRPSWNAFATPGGIVFVFKGLLDEVNDDELAAVLGHEIAHVTCRHTTERATQQESAELFSTRASSILYKSSYSTEQESEADRVGILYAALAGFEPRAAGRLWTKVHSKSGSDPGNYSYSHPLHRDRAVAAAKVGEIALKYFIGSGKINLKASEILYDNEIVRYNRNPGSQDTAIFDAAAGAYLKHEQTKEEVRRREAAAAAERKAQALKFISLANVRFADTADRKRGVFVDVTNGSNALMKKVLVEFRYLGDRDAVLYREAILVPNVPSGQTKTMGAYLRAVSGWKRISAVVIDLDY